MAPGDAADRRAKDHDARRKAPRQRGGTGNGTATFKTKAQPPKEVTVKYAVVWQKEGGQWKLLQDIWNMDK